MDRASSGSRIVHGVCILVLFLAGLLLAPVIATASDSQSWLDNNASITLNDKWRLLVTQEARFVEIPYGNHFLWNFSLGAGRTLPGNMSLAAAYKREVTDIGPITISENRYQVDFGWKRNFLRKSSFDTRLRTEYRTFEQSALENRFRVRLRLRLKTAISLGRLRLKPFIADEGFADSRTDKLDRNRFSLGTEFVVNSHLDILLGYLRQDTDDLGTIHTLLTGVTLRF